MSFTGSVESPSHLHISTSLPEECTDYDSYEKGLLRVIDIKNLTRIIPSGEELKFVVKDDADTITPVALGSRLIARFGAPPSPDISVVKEEIFETSSTLLLLEDSFLVFSGENPLEYTVAIYSEDGRMVREGTFDTSGIFRLSDLPPGPYIAYVASHHTAYSLKFIF